MKKRNVNKVSNPNVINKARQLRLYPNKEQSELIDKTFRACSFVYNYGLYARKNYKVTQSVLEESGYVFKNANKAQEEPSKKTNSKSKKKKDGKFIGYYETSKLLTELKKIEGAEWLKEVDSNALQQTLRDLDKAYQNLFAHRARKVKRKKFNSKNSYRTPAGGNKVAIDLEKRKIKLPKLGWVKYRGSDEVFEENPKLISATISKEPTGKYFVSVQYEVPKKQLIHICDNKEVGVDLGIKDYLIESNGNKVPNPKFLNKSLEKKKRLDRAVSRKYRKDLNYRSGERQSKNYEKAKHKRAVQAEKIKNQRKEFLHQQTTRLVHDNELICVESLDVKKMIEDPTIGKKKGVKRSKVQKKYARHQTDAAWGEFYRMLDYKADWYGSKIVKVDKYFASSQTCHDCGYKNTKVKDLSVRSWTCPKCGKKHDRDVNAAKNILTEGKRIIEETKVSS